MSPSPSAIGLLWRHKFKVALVFIAVNLAVVGYLALAELRYQSDAKLFVRVGRESVSLDPTATTGNFTSVVDSREREVTAVVELLQSSVIAEAVVDHFGADNILEKKPKQADAGLPLSERLAGLNDYNLNPLRVYSTRDKAIETFRKNFSVQPLKTSSVLSMSYQSDSPAMARDVLDFLLQTALDEHLRVHRTPGSQEFFVAQAELLRGNLADLEVKLKNLKDETGLASLTVQRDLQLHLIAALKEDLIRNATELNAVEAETQKRAQQLAATPEQVVTEQTTDQPQAIGQSLREKLYDLEALEQQLASKFTDDHPKLLVLRAQLSEARKLNEQEADPVQVTKGLNPAYQANSLALNDKLATLSALQARNASLAGELTTARGKVARLNAAEVEMGQLEREIDLARSNYRKYSDNLEESRINEELQQAKISGLTVMQPPTISETPVSPKPLVVLPVGFVLACLSAIAVALLFDRGAQPKKDAVASKQTKLEKPSEPAAEKKKSAEEEKAEPVELAAREQIAPGNPR